MYSDTGNTTSLVLGFPIRTSSDPRSVGSSPRHIAASHVLHRPLMPRHPPCALKHLQHKKTQKPKNNSEKITPQQTNTRKSPTPQREPDHRCQLDARNHYPRIKHHTPPPSRATTHLSPHRARTTGLLSQDPTVCLAVISRSSKPVNHGNRRHVHQNRTSTTDTVHLTNRLGLGNPRDAGRPKTRGAP